MLKLYYENASLMVAAFQKGNYFLSAYSYDMNENKKITKEELKN